ADTRWIAMLALHGHVVFFLCLQLAGFALGFSNVRCTAAVCPKDQRPVRKMEAPKIWAYGCDVPQGNGTLHRCCVEKEICMRTCGMPWQKCSKQFEKCAEQACDMDEDCILVAEEAEVLITGGESHFAVCKAHREAQQQLCECVPLSAAKSPAAQTDRLQAFYAAYQPQRLVDGKVKDFEDLNFSARACGTCLPWAPEVLTSCWCPGSC
ncbi:unnamed protein product, partial [Effrenium voratum]